MKRSRLLTLAAIALVALPLAARADTPPNKWEVAKNPELGELWALHVSVRDAIAREREADFRANRGALLLAQRDILTARHVESTPSVVLRFDLGQIEFMLGDYHRAIEILAPAIHDAPDHPAALVAGGAYETLANAYAHLDRSQEERDVYEAYIPRITNDATRAVALLNYAEVEMHLGELSQAVAQYKAAIALSASLPNIVQLEEGTGTLATWGLAVALDRSGDIGGSAAQARELAELDPGMRLIKGGVNVFFAPARERNWYIALGDIDTAKVEMSAGDVREAIVAWRHAERCFREYVEDAPPDDRWLSIARVRLETARAQRMAAEKRSKKPVPPSSASCGQ